MKNVVYLLILLLIFVPFEAQANGLSNIMNDKNMNEIVEKEKKRKVITNEFNKLLESQSIKNDNILSIGYLYTGKSGEVIIQLKKNLDNTLSGKTKKEKILKIVDRIQKEYGEKYVIVKEVDYSYENLDSIFNQLSFQMKSFNLENVPYTIELLEVENKVKLEIRSLPKKEIEELKNKFGSVLEIEVNPTLEYEKEEKGRLENWNSLGGGIGITTSRGGRCTMAGVAYKDSRYFILTAGHCIASTQQSIGLTGPIVKQYGANVGREHLNGIVTSGYDVGLVRVTRDTEINRNASNGLLKENTSLTGYDSKIRGDTRGFAVQDTVCKSGTSTGYTCGYIETTKKQYTLAGYSGYDLIGAKVQAFNMTYDLSAGGDSGSPWYDVNNNLIGIHSSGNDDNYAHFARWIDVSAQYGLYLYTSDNIYGIPSIQ